MIIDRKISAFHELVAMLEDRPKLTPAELKNWFDSAVKQLCAQYNLTIDDLLSVAENASGAKNIGVSAIEHTGTLLEAQNVQEALEELFRGVVTSIQNSGELLGELQNKKLDKEFGSESAEIDYLSEILVPAKAFVNAEAKQVTIALETAISNSQALAYKLDENFENLRDSSADIDASTLLVVRSYPGTEGSFTGQLTLENFIYIFFSIINPTAYGTNGTFLSADGKTVTVNNGIISSIE